MTALRRSRFRSAAVVLALATVLAACGGGDDEPAAAPTPTPSATETPSASPPPPPPPAPDPLTGAGSAPTTPLVAIKIDNAPLARPFHQGLESASVMYLELVEGGATRFLGLWSQPHGGEVGPIRSFRESDIELLAQFGRPAVGFSGANDGVLRSFRAAVAAGQLANASYDDHKELYAIRGRRSDAKNFYAVPDRLGQVGGAQPAKAVGWTHAAAPPAGAPAAASARVTFSDRSTVEVRYEAGCACYLLVQDGVALPGFRPRNVVVQQVAVRASGYRDVTGAQTPYTVTVGSGAVDVFRDGLRVTGQWQRPDAASGTRLLDAAGADLPLSPGPTLVLLQPAGLPLRTG